MNQNSMPLADALIRYAHSDRLSMHVPGHKRFCEAELSELYGLLGEKALTADITEISGFDDFHNPEDIIKEAQDLAAELFGSEQTFFLVNGTTSGIMAAVCAAAGEEEVVAVAGDCHKSVTRGLVLSGAQPVYIRPWIDSETGIPAGISARELENVLQHTGARALVLTNPSYYGTYSDLKEIVHTAHQRGVMVIVDEAHGGHLRFSGQPEIPDAMTAGADISVQSTHKMLGSLTQSSMLHVQGTLADREKLAYYIRLLTSTSPSYLLMGSLDAVRHGMAARGRRIWEHLVKLTDQYAETISSIPGISCVRSFRNSAGQVCPLDRGRLLITARELGLTGQELGRLLLEEHGIDVELTDLRYALAVSGSGTSEEDLIRLAEALRKLSEEKRKKTGLISWEDNVLPDLKESISAAAAAADLTHICRVTPRKAVLARHDRIELPFSAGRIAAEEIAVYPPGIPLLVPGERIGESVLQMIPRLLKQGFHIHGIHRVRENGTEKIMLMTAEDPEQSMLFDCIF